METPAHEAVSILADSYSYALWMGAVPADAHFPKA